MTSIVLEKIKELSIEALKHKLEITAVCRDIDLHEDSESLTFQIGESFCVEMQRVGDKCFAEINCIAQYISREDYDETVEAYVNTLISTVSILEPRLKNENE